MSTRIGVWFALSSLAAGALVACSSDSTSGSAANGDAGAGAHSSEAGSSSVSEGGAAGEAGAAGSAPAAAGAAGDTSSAGGATGGTAGGGDASGGSAGRAAIQCTGLASNGACTTMSDGYTSCEEATGSSYASAASKSQQQSVCSGQSGSFSTSCATAGVYGRCIVDCGADDETILYYYDEIAGDAGKGTCNHTTGNVWDGP